MKRGIVTLAAVGAIVAGGVIGGAQGTAFADGPDTPPEVLNQIEQSQYPELRDGDVRWEVAVVEYLLVDYEYFKTEIVDETYDSSLHDAVRDYHADNGLPAGSKIGDESWERMKEDFGEVASGDERMRVSAVQYALSKGHGYDLEVDQQYGEKTKNAVIDFQKSVGIDADGIVGPVTFKALMSE